MLKVTEIVEVLEEQGQELSSKRDKFWHELGELMLFGASVLNGNDVAKAAATVVDYRERWEKEVTPFGKISEKVWRMYKELRTAEVLEDRREYDEEDVRKAYPDMSKEECHQLYELFQG